MLDARPVGPGARFHASIEPCRGVASRDLSGVEKPNSFLRSEETAGANGLVPLWADERPELLATAISAVASISDTRLTSAPRPKPPRVGLAQLSRVVTAMATNLRLLAECQLYLLERPFYDRRFSWGSAMDDVLRAASFVAALAVRPIGLVLMAAGLACGIFRRPWYVAPFLAPIYTVETVFFVVSLMGGLGLGHPADRYSLLHKLFVYGLFLWAYTVFSFPAYGLGRWIGRRIAPGQADMRGPREVLIVIALMIATVIAAVSAPFYFLMHVMR